MGVDSGLPDFRGREGFWRAYPALREAGVEFTEIASPVAFNSVPDRAWGFFGHRLQLYRDTLPHAGFGILKRWGERMLHGMRVFTSNVDGQFQKAGFDERLIYECHGSIHHLQCLNACHDGIWSAAAFQPEVDEHQCKLLNAPPLCPQCGGLARPNILMFSDFSWLEARSAQQRSRQDAWLASVTRPVVIELGAGMAIPTVRRFSHELIHRHGGRLIRINPTDPQVPTSLDVGLRVGGLAALRAIEEALSRNDIDRFDPA
jgi:NAD-dependent SIR2 family protein deacetylase